MELNIIPRSSAIFLKIYQRPVKTNGPNETTIEKNTEYEWTEERENDFKKEKKISSGTTVS